MQGPVVRAGIDRLDDTDVPCGKGGLAVLQVEVPFADEAVVKAQCLHVIQFGVEALEPEAQRLRVACA